MDHVVATCFICYMQYSIVSVLLKNIKLIRVKISAATNINDVTNGLCDFTF